MDITGKCLIARPGLVDPFFLKSVVFVYEHTSRGTAGVILNKKLNATTKQLMLNKGFDAQVPEEPMFAGGPVNERAVIMLHSRDWRSGNTMNITESLGITSDDHMLFRYTQGDTARYYRFFAGCSVWHPQQIKQEIARNSWLIADIDLNVIFDTNPRHLWDTAVEQTASETMDRFL